MQAREQRLEVEAVRSGDDELPVQDEPALRALQQRLDHLGEVAGERTLVPAAQVDLVAVAERETAEAVPFRFVEVRAAGKVAREPRQHRRERRPELVSA